MSSKPNLLILIASKNRSHLLLNILQQLNSQLEENDLVIISDASDVIPNLDIIKFCRQHAQKFQHYMNSSIGLPANRNYALRIFPDKPIDYWCFFDDDLVIPSDYIQNVRILISQIDNRTAVTGYLNSEIPKSPDWLGFYRRRALKNGVLEMPHSVGTWVPFRELPKFRYESEHLYGYDELELRDYLKLNGIVLNFAPGLIISHPHHDFATVRFMTKWGIDKIRIKQNVKSMRRNGSRKISVNLYILRSFLHAFFYLLFKYCIGKVVKTFGKM